MRWWTVSLLTLVMLSGCTTGGGFFSGQDQGTGTDGMELSFQHLESFSLEGEEVTLHLTAENVGQGTAQEVEAQLFGAFSSDSVGLGTLQGIDRAAGQSGDTVVHEWSRTAPENLEEGEADTLEAGVRVTYGYDTQATLPVELDPESFVTSPLQVSVGNTVGPVQVSSSLESPIPTGGERQEHSVPLTVTDEGDGELESDVVLDTELVDPPSGVSLDCGGSVSLSVTEEGTTTCTLSTPEGGVPFQTEVQVRINTVYTYAQEDTTSVTVRGTS